jgi:hypothetical protein
MYGERGGKENNERRLKNYSGSVDQLMRVAGERAAGMDKI